MPAEDELKSLQQQLANKRKHLLLIQERISSYPLNTDVPLSLIKAEQERQSEIAEIEARLKELESTPAEIESISDTAPVPPPRHITRNYKYDHRTRADLYWIISYVKQLEPISFLIGLILGPIIFVVVVLSLRPALITDPLIEPAVSATMVAWKTMMEQDSERNSLGLEVLEMGVGPLNQRDGHYELTANTNYQIKVVGLDVSSAKTEFIWNTEPADFVDLPNTVDPEIRIRAPFDKVDSAGKIIVCMRQLGGTCQNFTREVITVVIFSK